MSNVCFCTFCHTCKRFFFLLGEAVLIFNDYFSLNNKKLTVKVIYFLLIIETNQNFNVT